MDHQRGKDPTPQGRVPANAIPDREVTEPIMGDDQFDSSVPGPKVRRDNAWFFGHKRDRTR